MADNALVIRLGKLVTRRRQLLASRSARDEKLMTEDAGPEYTEELPNAGTKRHVDDVLCSNTIQTHAEATNAKAPRSQLSGSRQTVMTKATVLCQEMRQEDGPTASYSLPVSEYAPSLASSYAIGLRVVIPKRPRDQTGQELEDFKCPYCFVACHVGSQDRWKLVTPYSLCSKCCNFDLRMIENMFSEIFYLMSALSRDAHYPSTCSRSETSGISTSFRATEPNGDAVKNAILVIQTKQAFWLT